jgi:Cdc6-like AAA superfamily ATPase
MNINIDEFDTTTLSDNDDMTIYSHPHPGRIEWDDYDDDEDEDVKKKPKSSQYMLKDGKYLPVQDTVPKLPAGYYRPELNRYNGEIYAAPKEVVLPKLYDLPNGLHQELLADIKHFWESEERYKKFGNVYKRNILLYSVPGNGKTSLINQICQQVINDYDGIVMSIDDEDTLQTYPKLMEMIRQIEPKRKVVTVIEDFERLIQKDYLSALLLQMLDGASQYNGVLTIATTNFPEKVGKQYLARPSRFNIVKEYKKPDEEVRKFYIFHKLADAGIELDDKVKEDIERYVKKTEGYTFDYVKEVIEAIYIGEVPEDEAFDRINKSIKKDGNYKTTENEPSHLGF